MPRLSPMQHAIKTLEKQIEKLEGKIEQDKIRLANAKRSLQQMSEAEQ